MTEATLPELRQLVFETSVAYAKELQSGSVQSAELKRKEVLDAFLAQHGDGKYVVQIVCRMGHIFERSGNAPPEEIVAGILACPTCGARADWVRRRPLIVTEPSDDSPQSGAAA